MNQPIEFHVDDARQRVDVTVGGHPFTAYIWPTSIKKPVLYPLRTPRGSVFTRGYPLDPRPGERVDHPHHVGMWFNFGDVNGLDFWNNSDAIPEAKRDKFGTIVHRGIDRAAGGAEQGTLDVTMEWCTPDGVVLLIENTSFIFRGTSDRRSIDRITRLTAQRQEVLFRDNKEGTFGIRVARALEQPTNDPLFLTDTQGKPEGVPRVDNTGVTGRYRSSNGLEGDAVWATRGEWVKLGATIGDEPISLAIIDHPANPGHPTYWHARGYGLFAANPLGQEPLSKGKDKLNLLLTPGSSTTFRHRVIVASANLDDATLGREFAAFAAC